MSRVRRLKLALWAIAGLAAAVGATRMIIGLGATSNLSDATPWGLWIGFDVMAGVALASGGFIITASVYIFKLERFHAVVRPAVLTAFLGYLAVVVGLLFDLGGKHIGFFLAHHLALPNQNIYELLQYCSTLEFLPPRAQESARNLSLRVDEHFHLPPGVDLLEETEKLIQVLESVPMEEMP